MSNRWYLVGVTVRGRLFWTAVCGLMAYAFLRQPIHRWEDCVLAAIGVGFGVLSAMAFIAAIQLLWLRITVTFKH